MFLQIYNRSCFSLIKQDMRKSSASINMSMDNNNRLKSRLQSQLSTNAKFMDNFDPDQSSRTLKKQNNPSMEDKNANKWRLDNVFDHHGRYRESGINACDCLLTYCTGCHFPCSNCHSTRCGPQCRVNRRFAYSAIEMEGDKDNKAITANPYVNVKQENEND